MAEQQKFTIKVAKKMPEDVQKALAIEVIDFIIERSKKGKDKDNKSFTSYSKEYAKSFDFKLAGKNKNKVDLTLTGEMLNSLQVIDISEGEITIGFNERDKLNNDKAAGNILGSYGGKPNSKNARDFLGIKKSDLDKIKEAYPVKTKEDREGSLDLAAGLLAADEAGAATAGSFFFEGLDDG